MAADLCYYRCYPKDYLGSPIISRMTLEEQGAHQRLMAHGWQMDGIPIDRREIATLLGLEPGSERAERIITRVIDLAWKPDSDNPRVLRNDEQEKERREVTAAYHRRCDRTAAARKQRAENRDHLPKNSVTTSVTENVTMSVGGSVTTPIIQNTEYRIQRTALKDIPSATSAENSHTTGNPPSSHTADKPPNPGKPQRASPGPDPAFDEFRRHYPKGPNHSWAKARILWDRNLRKGVHPEAMISGATLYKAHCVREGLEPRFIKHPETFLGEGRWWEADYGPPEDEGGDLPTYLPDGSINPLLQRLLGGRRS